MLRKIFISLLILSALTSRGAGNELNNAPNTTDGFLNLSAEKYLADSEMPQQGKLAMPRGMTALAGSALLTIEEFIRVKSLEQHIFSNLAYGYPDGSRQIFLLCLRPASGSYNENQIPFAADSSPPALL